MINRPGGREKGDGDPVAFEEVHAADVAISRMAATARRAGVRAELDVEIEIHSDNDDDAQHVRCIVVLPPTSQLVTTHPPAVAGPTWPAVGPSPYIQSEPVQGYVIFEPANPMVVGETLQLHVMATVHESYAEHPIAAFVFSSLPDPNPANNSRSVRAKLPAIRVARSK